MKRILLLLPLLALFSNAMSQLKVGLNFSPALAFNRVTMEQDDSLYTYSKKGAAFKFIAGPELNFFLSDNFCISTGAWYAAKRININAKSNTGTFDTTLKYNLQYIQLPLMMKMFTNEITTDMRLYFSVGGAFDIKVGEKVKGSTKKTDAQFTPFDVSLIAGTGVEYKIGENTVLLGGIRYNRGLLNIARNKRDLRDLNVKADLFALDIGIRF